tara:strand:+ start:940 stop:2370 length:1431 start_codon:yes stop_codon:yes gene_type:complete
MASFLINSAAETFNGSDTTDTFEVITGASAVTVNGLAGDDTVTLSASAGTLGDSVFAMGDGDDTFDIATANSTGHDYQSASIRGGEGQDTINIGLFSAEINNVSVNGNEGDDTINVNLTSIDGTASSITVLGGESADTITVTSDDDVHEFYLGGGQDDDAIVYLGGTFTDSTLIGGFGEDTASAGMDVDSSLIQLGNGTDGATDSADLLNYSGVIANSTIKGGAGGDTLNIQLDDNSTATIIEGNAGADTFNISAIANVDFESTEIRGGAGDDAINLSGAAGDNVSAEIYGGQGADNIDFIGVTGIIIEGGQGADAMEWGTGEATYVYNFGDSNEGSADTIEAGAAVTGNDVTIRVDGSDLAIKTAEASTVSVDGTDYTLTFEGGVVFFGDTGINDVTAAVDFMDGALGDDVAGVFSFATGELQAAAGTEFYFYAKGQGDETDLLVEMTDIGVGAVTGYTLTEANNFGNTEFTFTL